MLAIIGGSGLTRLSTLAVAHREVVRTPYGEPSSALVFGRLGDRDVVFLARHGHGHTIPPHRVNYRANLWALKQRSVDAILAVASVGGISGVHAPGDLVLPHQLIDYTSGREQTFFDGGDRQVVHVDFTHPYSAELRARCLAAAGNARIALHDGGVYGAVSGPRRETAAEIDRRERDGATIVGMTAMPEAGLARESERLRFDRGGGQPCRGARRQRSGGDCMDSIAGVLEKAMDKVRLLVERSARGCRVSARYSAWAIRDCWSGRSRFALRHARARAARGDMRETMAATNGAGLAAPQIGWACAWSLRRRPQPALSTPGRFPTRSLVNPVLAP
jgi:5'-methylthioadenosine phosphorylase